RVVSFPSEPPAHPLQSFLLLAYVPRPREESDMRRAPCPICGNVNVIADREWGTEVECEGLGPPHRFLALDRTSTLAWSPPAPPAASPVAPPHRRRREVPPPAPPPPPPPPLLTAPHRCQQCSGEITRAFGRRRDTVAHEQDGRASCRTDIFA